MGIKKLNPTNAGSRHKIAHTFDELTTDQPHAPLLVRLKKTGGRNNTGKRTMRHIGGGHKRHYRLVDFRRDKHDVSAKVLTVEYDPNRSARICLLEYADGEKRYILAPQGIRVGQTVMSGSTAAPEVGNTLFMRDIPLGTVIHNIEAMPGRGGAIARSAGSFAQLSARDGIYAILSMPSGETRKVLADGLATIGVVGNAEHNQVRSGKAGRTRWLGRKPRVRGVAMNPVDHPMGGGEGRASGGHPRSRKGKVSKGLKTRQPKKPSSKFIIERRKK